MHVTMACVGVERTHQILCVGLCCASDIINAAKSAQLISLPIGPNLSSNSHHNIPIHFIHF